MTKKLHHPKPRMTPIKVGSIIQSMAMRECSSDEWRRFTAAPIEHPELEAIRLRCLGLPKIYPPETSDDYCGAEGRQIMFRITDGLYRYPGARRKQVWEGLIYDKSRNA